MTITLHEAAAQDEKVVIQLWQTCDLTRPWNDPKTDFSLAMSSAASTILLAMDGNDTIGTVMTGFDGHRGWTYYLATRPDRQRQGVARLLLSGAERWLTERGCPKVELMVRNGNPAADFYKRIGWEKQDVDVYARWLNKKDE